MAYFYTYTDPSKIEAQFAHLEPEDKDLDMNKRDMLENHNEKRRKSSDSSSDEEEKKQTNF